MSIFKYSYPKKIAFEGAICTGKTTILKYYQEKYPASSKMAFVNEAGREYLQLNPDLDYQSSVGVSEEIQSLAFAKEKAAHDSRAHIILCDRSVLSAVIYERVNGNSQESKRLLKKVESWLSTYTIILLFDPTDIPYTYDRVRKGDTEQRKRYHETFHETFNELQIPYKLINGTLEKRIQTIDKILLNYSSL